MIITFQGENSLKIQTGSQVVLIDPLNQRSFKGANAVLSTISPSPFSALETREPFQIEHQGEYEVNGIPIKGWQSAHTNGKEYTIYHMVMDDISIGILGHLSKEPNPDIQEALQGVDILVVPGGSEEYLAPHPCAKLIRQIEPGVVIPTLFDKKTLANFLKEMNQVDRTEEEKLVIKKKEITPGAMRVVVLAHE